MKFYFHNNSTKMTFIKMNIKYTLCVYEYKQ